LPIKYIITVQALKEGWDCSFAYVLCSVAGSHSVTAVEQLLGRVLRMPYASARTVPELNRAYAHVSAKGWPQALIKMRDQLVNMGFERYQAEDNTEINDGTIQGELPGLLPADTFIAPINTLPDLTSFSSDEQEKIQVKEEAGVYWLHIQSPSAGLLNKITDTAVIDKKDKEELALRTKKWLQRQPENLSPAERGEPFTVPQLCLIFDNEAQPLELKPCLYPDGWNPLDYYQPLPFSVDKKANVYLLDINNEQIRIAQEHIVQLSLSNVPTDITLDDLVFSIKHKLRLELSLTAMGGNADNKLHNYIHKSLQDLLCRDDISLPMLGYARSLLQRLIKNSWQTAQKAAYKHAFQRQLFADDQRIGTDPEYIFTFSPHHYPIRKPYIGDQVFKYHYYRHIADMNGEEAQCAWALERQYPKIKYWVRNLENQMLHAFWLQTSTDKFYPDFVAQLDDGRILVVEYKGAFLDNEDTREKEQIGKVWAEKSGNLFLMLWKKDKQGRDMDAQLQYVLQSS